MRLLGCITVAAHETHAIFSAESATMEILTVQNGPKNRNKEVEVDRVSTVPNYEVNCHATCELSLWQVEGDKNSYAPLAPSVNKVVESSGEKGYNWEMETGKTLHLQSP